MTQPNDFNYDDHERQIAEYYAKRNKYEVFDQLIDLALDSAEVTVAQAITAYKQEFAEE